MTQFLFGLRNRKMTSRIRSRAWFFTLDNGDENMVAQLCDSFNDIEYVFQLERGSSGMIHFQGVVRYPNAVSNWPEVNAHWERCRNWRQAIKYCTKVDTRIKGPWTNIPKLTWRRTILSPLEGKVLYDWQNDIMNIVKNYADDRTVHWYWDPVGCTGKSSLAKHLVMNRKCCLLNGSSKDSFCALTHYTEDDDIDIVVFDLSRSQENRVSYTAIEGVKNGFFFSGKYESKHVIMNSPHVIVFANFAPDVNKLSLDRWNIVNISAVRTPPSPASGGGSVGIPPFSRE